MYRPKKSNDQRKLVSKTLDIFQHSLRHGKWFEIKTFKPLIQQKKN